MITIAIPTYKRPKYLDEAICSAINQKNNIHEYKIIVVNNDPKADMSVFAEKYKDYNIEFYVNEDNLGMFGNMNRCIELCETKYISFLHDDDLLLPNYISSMEQVLETREFGCIIPKRYLLFENGKKKGIERKKRIKNLVIKSFLPRYLNIKNMYELKVEDNIYSWQNCYGAPSCGVLFNVNSLKKNGLFITNGTLAWDFISFLGFNKKEKIFILNKKLSIYRMTSGVSGKLSTIQDFYTSYEDLKEENKEHPFVSNYFEEITCLNKLLIGERVKKKNILKYYIFMLKRQIYFSYHHLDIEVMLDKYALNFLETRECEKNEKCNCNRS